MGKIGTSGLVPEGYFKDEKKSAETFKEINGVRYSFPEITQPLMRTALLIF